MAGESTSAGPNRMLTLTRRVGSSPDAIAPDGSEIRLLLSGAEGSTRASLCEVTLPAGQTSRAIWHRHVEEIWYVISGRGDVWREAPENRAEPSPSIAVTNGDALVIRAGWRFQFRASPDGALRFLCFTAPPWPGEDEAVPSATTGLGEPTV